MATTKAAQKENAVERTATQRMIDVMRDVRSLGKDQYNPGQKFKFRGIDDLMNLLGPVLRDHEIIIRPTIVRQESDAYTTINDRGQERRMQRVVLHVEYAFTAPDGTEFIITGSGEGADSADKATSKAMSMAMKYAVIQMLCLPTDEPDPDAADKPDAVPASAQLSPAEVERQKLLDQATARGADTQELAKQFLEKYGKEIKEGDAAEVNAFRLSVFGGGDE